MPTTLTSTNITAVQFKESASPGTPSSGYGRVWVYTDGTLHYIDDAGTNHNISGMYTGAIALASQAIGDLIIATSTTQLGRVADVAVGQVLVSGGVGVAPAWSATPTLTTVTANLTGNVTGNVTGNCSGTAATVTGAAQTAITSVGTLSGLTVTNPIVGSVTGSSATCSGLAATATALATARAINGVNFDGTAAITVTAAADTLTGTTLKSTVVASSLTSVGTVTSGTWSGLFGAVTGANLTNLTAANISAGTAGIDVTGNAATATALATARTISRVSFDGSSNINLEVVKALTDGATPALDASLGSVFRLAAAGNRTIAVPSNAVAGQKIVIQHYASGGARTLALNTGAGGFRYGTDITALTETASGKTDYIGAIYNGTDSFWDVVGYIKGF